jgi:hypothetical protein
MRHRFLQVQENTETIFLPTGGLRAIRLFLQVPQSCLQPPFRRLSDTVIKPRTMLKD